MKSICFITTGDIKRIATSKRALGMANNLSDLGWKVYILMEDTSENRHRVGLECDGRTEVFYFPSSSAYVERKEKERLLARIKPDYMYICAFVFRNIVYPPYRCVRLVEHSELRSAIKDVKWWRRLYELFVEYYSIIYGDGLLNASVFLQKLYKSRCVRVFRSGLPMLYFPYAYSEKLYGKGVIPVGLALEKHENDVFVTYLGSLSKAYRTIDIVKAVQLIGDIRIKVLLLGDGDDSNRIKKYVADNALQEVVWMPGYINEEHISAYFSMTDVFVLPMNDTVQDKARCPSKLYMYLPYGKPIVTAKVGEPFEVLKDDGVYYQAGSVDSLALAIKEAIAKKELGASPELHEWKERVHVFDSWIKNSFDKK